MFEIATQFNAIFRAQASAGRRMSMSLLSMWASRRVHSFLSMLEVQLVQTEDSAALRDSLDACVFFAASMGRLGADFTAQMSPLFEKRMHIFVVHFWEDGVAQLGDTLKICREAGVASPLTSSTVTTSGESDASIDPQSGPLSPPRRLMSFPPLGRLVNAILTGLNELRRCLLPGVLPKLRESLAETLSDVDAVLQANERAVMTPGLRGDAAELRAIAREMKDVMSNVVNPYLRGALEVSIGNEARSKEFFAVVSPSFDEQEEEEIGREVTIEEQKEDTDSTIHSDVPMEHPQQAETQDPNGDAETNP